MQGGLIFAVLCAIAFGAWTVFHQRASAHIHYLIGAIIVSFIATLLGLAFLLVKLKTVELYASPQGLLFAVLAGVCALAIDVLALKSYGAGLPISIGGPIIIGGSIAFATVIGFCLGDKITALKLLGLALVTSGAGLLGVFG